ncbi:MAG: DUF507 family protein [Deltaproteobacteria bacterium]|nr:MAG: DUF507 family protein [Deltaproteobacteria bacterium]
MRLYKSKVPRIADEIVNDLVTEGMIEIDEESEDSDVKAGIEAILMEYIRMDQRLSEQTKDHLAQRAYDHREFRKIKQTLADRKNFGIGDDMLDYLTNQIISWFMVTPHVAEVFSEDHELRRRMVQIFRRHLDIDVTLDREVRARLKNLEEGTLQWEIEYDRVLRELKRKRGIA